MSLQDCRVGGLAGKARGGKGLAMFKFGYARREYVVTIDLFSWFEFGRTGSLGPGGVYPLVVRYRPFGTVKVCLPESRMLV
jgi:hypothetical protein